MSFHFPHTPELSFQVFWHPDTMLHETDTGHPESVSRMESILEGISELSPSLALSMTKAPSAKIHQLANIHSKNYLQYLEETCLQGKSTFMAEDNSICEDSFRGILAAAGQALALGKHLSQGGQGFALTRPPGHHAGPEKAEGFCYTNHIACAISEIRKANPTSRVLVVDFDVHHGNGIDHFFYRDPRVFYYSLHGSPDHIYPGTGREEEKGEGPGEGYSRNITLPLNSTGERWIESFEANLQLCLMEFSCDYIVVSAGFDAHHQDPFSLLKVEDEHFLKAIKSLNQMAKKHCDGKIGYVLEGGYSLDVLKRLVPLSIQELITEFNS